MDFELLCHIECSEISKELVTKVSFLDFSYSFEVTVAINSKSIIQHSKFPKG